MFLYSPISLYSAFGQAFAARVNVDVEQSPTIIKRNPLKRTRDSALELSDVDQPPAAKKAKKDTKAPSPTGDIAETACQVYPPGRVFALWSEEDGPEYYYTGTVKNYWEVSTSGEKVKQSGSSGQPKGKGKASFKTTTMCKVKLDNGSSAEVPLDQIRRCQLAVGDRVEIPGAKPRSNRRMGKVCALISWADRGKASVEINPRPKEEVSVVDQKKLSVLATTVAKHWDDRRVTRIEEVGLGDAKAAIIEAEENKYKGMTKPPHHQSLGLKGQSGETRQLSWILMKNAISHTETCATGGRSRRGI